jgi:hypothetical protein
MSASYYLSLFEESNNDSYDNYNSLDESVDCYAWIPGEPDIKKKRPTKFGTLDASNLKREEIRLKLKNCQQIIINDFMICVKENPASKIVSKEPVYTIIIYETIRKTLTGNPCNIQKKLNTAADDRFNKCSWARIFDYNGVATNIKEDLFLDIIKWLKAAGNLIALF